MERVLDGQQSILFCVLALLQAREAMGSGYQLLGNT
jgi:hypothetical protein